MDYLPHVKVHRYVFTAFYSIGQRELLKATKQHLKFDKLKFAKFANVFYLLYKHKFRFLGYFPSFLLQVLTSFQIYEIVGLREMSYRFSLGIY